VGLQHSRGYDSKVQMPITPMLDMTFQLLFFFLLNYHPSALEGQMDLALPTDKPAVAEKNESVPLDKDIGDPDDPEEPPEVTVIIKAIQGDDPNTLGQISEISVQLKEGKTTIPPPGAEEPGDPMKLWMAKLQDHLKNVRETLGNKNDVILKGERRLRWQYVVKVRDACQKAGFRNAHFSPPPDL
jgi:biopolymer transport protein ExbD